MVGRTVTLFGEKERPMIVRTIVLHVLVRSPMSQPNVVHLFAVLLASPSKKGLGGRSNDRSRTQTPENKKGRLARTAVVNALDCTEVELRTRTRFVLLFITRSHTLWPNEIPFYPCMYPGSFIFMNIQQQEKDTTRQVKPITWKKEEKRFCKKCEILHRFMNLYGFGQSFKLRWIPHTQKDVIFHNINPREREKQYYSDVKFMCKMSTLSLYPMKSYDPVSFYLSKRTFFFHVLGSSPDSWL